VVKTLILGGVRSGKSRHAEQLAAASDRAVTVLATARALDAEMTRRIAAHRALRPPHWAVVEEPRALGAALKSADGDERIIIVDCLTLWLTQLLDEPEEVLAAETALLLEAVATARADVLLIGNETSLGIMPLGELTRRYGDLAGRLHQDLAARCDRVVLMVAGLPLSLKGPA
jgi:adenosylcobinamide kinase / adenosylcobinamide-phosphate guanylyltransferase